MQKLTGLLFLVFLIISSCDDEGSKPEIPSGLAIPSAQQLEYQQMEFVGFIHFTVNTFTDMEWGSGAEDPSIFNPTALDAEQWVITAKNAGMKELILTAKHHDGFCLWPSAFTEHSIKNSPYKNGQGDVVKEFTEACRKHGLKAGLYLSPWDRNHADYGKPEYISYYRKQLKELLTNYGEINEIWFDGANGGYGYYGGANEERRIDKKTYYDWENTIQLVKELQPDIKIFSDAGPDIRWVGNEHGFAGETFWSAIHSDSLVIGGSDPAYLNQGEANGNAWIIGQCDVSIHPGWFYHESQDKQVKSPEHLLDIYYKSVGRNGVLLLNLPPDKRGLIHENDIAALSAFKKKLDRKFKTNLASNNRVLLLDNNKPVFSKHLKNLTDDKFETYWSCQKSADPVSLVLDLTTETKFDHIVLQEAIQFGQRIGNFRLSIEEDGGWRTVFEGSTIGYKRIISIDEEQSRKLKLEVLDFLHPPVLAEISIYNSSIE